MPTVSPRSFPTVLPYSPHSDLPASHPGRTVLPHRLKLFTSHSSNEWLTSFSGLNLQRLLRSPFVHVDETRLSIQGNDHYVWVFTDGAHVLFKLTETRESTIVQEVLKNYHGSLISYFYG